MGQPAKIARNHVGEPYVPRIRALLEAADLRGARHLLAEALENGSLEPELNRLEKLLAPPRFELRPASDFDRSAEIHWLKEHANEYRGRWVALLGPDLLAHAPTLDELMTKLDSIPREARALLHRIR
jgi:hypothetical protein